MKRASVLLVNTKTRIAKVQIDGGEARVIEIPVDKSYVTQGCEVTIDEESGTLVDVLDIPSNDKDPYDPLVKTRPGVGRGNSDAHWTPSDAIETLGGDYYFQPNKGGFIALMRGFAAFLGGGPLAQIRFFATKKLAQIIADNFQILGNQVDISIQQSDDTAQPHVRMAVGTLIVEADTAGSKLTLEYGGYFRLIVSPDRTGIDVRDPETQNFLPIYELKPAGEKNILQIRQVYSDYVAEAAHYMINAGQTFEVNTKELTLATSILNLIAATDASIVAKNMEQQVSEKYHVTAGSEVHTVGNMGMPGSFQVNNGITSSFRMNEAGMMELFALTGINLNGVGDFAASAIQTEKLLTTIFTYLLSLNTALMMVPGMQSFSGKNMMDLLQASLNIGLVQNNFVRMGPGAPIRLT